MANFVSYADAQQLMTNIGNKLKAMNGAYVIKGNSTFSGLETSLTKAMNGYVYNVTDDFTTTVDFVEGAGKKYPAGTNVVIVNTGTDQSPIMKYDVISSFVDVDAIYAEIEKISDMISVDDFDNTRAYQSGDIVKYENKLYTFTKSYHMGKWKASDVESVTVVQKMLINLDTKVDKITGKGLSTNDYTTAEKTKLSEIDEHATAVGKNVTGTEYTINGSTVTAGNGAEIFNDYIDNKASGDYSHAEGYFTTASGSYSHAEGNHTTSSGSYSHAEGVYTTASGNYSHAEGKNTFASGHFSHAEGNHTTASGVYSHAEGYNTVASSDSQHAQGRNNIEDKASKYAFIIGNGTDGSNRSNAFAVDWNGLIYINNAQTGVDVSKMKTIWTGTQSEYQQLTSTNEYDFYCIYEEDDAS